MRSGLLRSSQDQRFDVPGSSSHAHFEGTASCQDGELRFAFDLEPGATVTIEPGRD